jgi:hypothetical protein
VVVAEALVAHVVLPLFRIAPSTVIVLLPFRVTPFSAVVLLFRVASFSAIVLLLFLDSRATAAFTAPCHRVFREIGHHRHHTPLASTRFLSCANAIYRGNRHRYQHCDEVRCPGRGTVNISKGFLTTGYFQITLFNDTVYLTETTSITAASCCY